ncbi:MAG: MMPL family transporter, partial [Gemmatimonadetes bacterium]|nr:MMPL family transporter [Gemmatimonadota bacterium]
KLGSDDGLALALYIPLEAKEYADEVAKAVHEWTAAHPGDETVHVAGLPVAEDTFGLQMFQQMAMFAPAAFAVIFVLMLLFFKRLSLVLAPMIVAMMTVLWTMGALVGTGFTVHIMSSMIPVFLMPIAVLDSIHILSEVHDQRSRFRSMKETMEHVLNHLFMPITLTTITTMVGFSALIMTPIPPVQVFGGFVALGVASAWFLSLTFNPAFAVLVSAKRDAAAAAQEDKVPAQVAPEEPLGGPLQSVARGALKYRGVLIGGSAIALILAVMGITRISVNDNPVHWFKPDHPLRIAERDLGHHLAGTYLAYLQVDGGEDGAFLDPDALQWVDQLQAHVASLPNVGGVSSVTDIIKKVRQELLDGDPAAALLPDNQEAIAQMLFLYEIGGGDTEDLFKMITPEHDRVALWVQMIEGENKQVDAIVRGSADWIAANPPPGNLHADWAGLSIINVVWQDRMVSGMGKALAGSFGVVLLLMMLLFRSVRIGLVAMVPLTLTIAVTYGLVGWLGRDYDMPTAVLSSLSLGLSIDFAIHMLQRTRDLYRANGGDFALTMRQFFGSPARALARNIVVIAVGFAPMFFAALVPYMTVGAFFFAIMIVSGGATLLLLPAILSYLPGSVIGGRVPKEAS